MKKVTTMTRGKMLIILNKVPFFKDFTPYERERVVDNDAGFFVAEANEYIIEQGTLDTAFYILLSGGADVKLGDNETSVARIVPGDFFGEIAFLRNTPRTSHVVASETAILLRVDRRLLGALSADIREKIKDKIIDKLLMMLATAQAK
ncbi:MAG: cyclic nucleotide-binding domain-containing protein [Oceanospirillaceae bacterium]|nr:cyclic nucleotide-binding domain-containing protein [Oceanospirillaceae bacterium]MCP5350270.1 cyclic nucleotide-binding domain-containing protein [Oceanospirillaceae bacterium]